MDYLDWITYGAGGALGVLTGILALSRLSGSAERDIAPIWQSGFILSSGILALALVLGWIFPITTVVYVANGGEAPRQVRMGDEVLCLPAKSFENFAWRFSPPDAVVVGGEPNREERYPVGKGTWFINTAPIPVSADMYYGSDSVVFDALNASSSGVIRVDSRYGRPFRMFSQSGFDRVYSTDGDILRRSIDGPCTTRRSAAQ